MQRWPHWQLLIGRGGSPWLGSSTSMVAAVLAVTHLNADRSVDRTLIVTLGGLTAILIAFAMLMPFIAPTPVIIFLWGVASFALVPPLQVRVMSAAVDAPNLASSVNIGAFNLGNAIGAALGGAVIASGLGYPTVALAGAATSAIGLGAVLIAVRRTPVPDDRQLCGT
jgi:DHA1 family inner membrane transport protein